MSSVFKGKNIHWGTFTEQHNSYNKAHSIGKKKSLKTFANFILKHPNKFHSKTVKRARFYNNVILSASKKRRKTTRNTPIVK